jgi:dihydroorotase
MEGHAFNWKVEKTLCNGHVVYADGIVDREYIGEPIEFR